MTGDDRGRAINFRLSRQEMEVLEAWAFLQHTTATDAARAQTRALIERVSREDRVQDVIRARAEHGAEAAGALRPLRSRRQQAGDDASP